MLWMDGRGGAGSVLWLPKPGWKTPGGNVGEQKKVLLKDLIGEAAKQLRQDFAEIRKGNPHAGESGAEAEAVLAQFLRDKLPRRFDAATGFVVGRDGTVSKQADVIIYDALNCPVYRKGPRTQIFPRDNVAAVIEVKSKLNKAQLQDAAEKIASVKCLKASPITNVDQPVSLGDFIMTSVLGFVFAFESYTSLETLTDNLAEINSGRDSLDWIDAVVVLDKGFLEYVVQFPAGSGEVGSYGGIMTEDYPRPPFYVHLALSDSNEMALNRFYVKLMGHLTFFRKRSTVDFASALGPEKGKTQLMHGYQFNLAGKLVPAEKSHYRETFVNPQVRFNLYARVKRHLVGQVCRLPWQDGAAIMYSGSVDPMVVFEHYFRTLKLAGMWIPAGGKERLWFSMILPLSEADFIRASQDIHKDVISVRDSNDDEPPPVILPDDTASSALDASARPQQEGGRSTGNGSSDEMDGPTQE